MLGLVLLLVLRQAWQLPIVPDGLPDGQRFISGVAVIGPERPDLVMFHSDDAIRYSVGTDYQFGGRRRQNRGACLIITDAQRRVLIAMGGSAHVRGYARPRISSLRCPQERRSMRRGSPRYLPALHLDATQPLQAMACSAEQYVMSAGRCSGFRADGHPIRSRDRRTL